MSFFAHLDLIVLFFFLGIASGLLKINLRLPESVSQFLSIYLLLAIGLKGGQKIAAADTLVGFGPAISLGVASCIAIAIAVFFLARIRFGTANAAALAACYGSVSAITFVVAETFLNSHSIGSSGYMVAVMALMEIPAIAVALLLYEKLGRKESEEKPSWLRASLGHKSVLLLLGGFFIGLVSPEKDMIALKPLMTDAFKGFLAFYLIDLGAAAAGELGAVARRGLRAVVFACVLPVTFGLTALVLAYLAGVPRGDAVLLAVLTGSASYIAAPAAVRISIPVASPAVYTALPLALTFPLNILFGIPLYVWVSSKLFS